jgi:ribose transport system substrate-binding protein
MFKRPLVACIASAMLLACAHEEKRTTIAVLGKSAGGEYWLAVKHGAEQEAAKQGVKLLYLGQSSEQDVTGQIDLLENLIQRKVDGIAISPADSQALSPIVKKAVQAGIKVVTVDSDTTAKDRLCYIGTNNEQAGEVAGREMLRLLGAQKAKVATITGPEGAQNLTERVQGFNAVVGDRLDVLVPTSDEGNKDKSMAIAERTMTTHPDVAGFFSTTAIGGPAISQALATTGKSGQIKIISFDTTPTLIKQLKDGKVQVLIAQQPERMGALAVSSLVGAIKGDALPSVIDTGVVAVTLANVAKFDH